MDLKFYKGKKVLVTGHTGFKGSWLSTILVKAGAEVIGYSLSPPTNPNLFEISGIEKEINSITSDSGYIVPQYLSQSLKTTSS